MSPRQPLNMQGLLRVSGSGQTTATKNIYGTRLLITLRIGEKEEEYIEVMKMRKLSIMAVCKPDCAVTVIKSFTKVID